MAQNVLVCCRFRPPSQREIEEESETVVQVIDDNKTCQITLPSTTKKPSFNFDHVFDTNATQIEVFKHTALPMVKEIMNGYNTTIFAYGQTGSGKTFTMMGDRSSETTKGIIPRLVEAIFDAISSADEDIEFTIKLSYLEIYNERLRDLLNPDQDNLRIRESAAGVWVQDVTESYISSYEEVLEVMAAGEKYRAIAATKMNMESSRSHSVFILTLGQLHQKTGSRKGSKLTLVDLAGSEKVLKTGAEGQTLVEAQHINKSLSSLGNVINALTSKSKHIPYRDSKLTRLLSDSLGGNSKTCLIIACSPSSTNLEETLSTLRFGSRAKMIKNKPTVNQERSVAEYKRLLAAREATILKQQSYIQLLEEDVDALLKCISAVLPSHLVLPVPILKSAAMRKAGGVPHEPLTGVGTEDASAAEPGGEDEGAGSESERARVSEELDELDEKEGKEPESPRDIEDSPHVKSQLDKLEQEKMDLVDQLQDKTREVEDQVQLATLKRNELEAKLNQALKKQEEAELKVMMAEEKLNELARLQKKMALMEKEHELQTEQLRADKEELALKIASMSKIDEKESPRPARSGSVTSGSASSTVSPSPADAARQAQQAASELKRLKQNYEAIMRHLKKKCDQYMHLQVVHQDTKEMLKTTEEELASAKKTIADGAAQKKIKDLESQLEKSEEICKKLFESGKYWRQRRYAQEGSRRIPVPIKGGKKSTRKPEEEEGSAPGTSGRKPTPEELEETLSKLAASGGPVSIVGGKIQRKKSIHPTESTMDQFF